MYSKPHFSMKPIINSTELIAACGLYCGACKKYQKDKCPGCRKNRTATWCHIRRCCWKNGYNTCAECEVDASKCKYHNTFMGKLCSIIFNSDRPACIRYIRKNGEEAYAERMSWEELMTIRRR